jgi:hypothetical protein
MEQNLFIVSGHGSLFFYKVKEQGERTIKRSKIFSQGKILRFCGIAQKLALGTVSYFELDYQG